MRYRRYKLSRPSPTDPQDSVKGRKAVWFWLTADFVPDHTLGLPQGIMNLFHPGFLCGKLIAEDRIHSHG